MLKYKNRCAWAKNELSIKYHDKVWGTPVHDDYKLFYMLILEGMQAGLSWDTILQKWQNFFLTFDNFDISKIINYTENDIDKFMLNSNIIRNKLKLNSLPINAKAYQKLQMEHQTFSNFIWSYVNHQPIVNQWVNIEDVPASTDLSEQISKDLKKLGFKFIGSTIIYAYMQAVGMVNDHLVSCFRHPNHQIENCQK